MVLILSVRRSASVAANQRWRATTSTAPTTAPAASVPATPTDRRSSDTVLPRGPKSRP